jgi:hypothetical protein
MIIKPLNGSIMKDRVFLSPHRVGWRVEVEERYLGGRWKRKVGSGRWKVAGRVYLIFEEVKDTAYVLPANIIYLYLFLKSNSSSLLEDRR